MTAQVYTRQTFTSGAEFAHREGYTEEAELAGTIWCWDCTEEVTGAYTHEARPFDGHTLTVPVCASCKQEYTRQRIARRLHAYCTRGG